jgi:hypothetical protein
MRKAHSLLIMSLFFVKFCIAQDGSDLKDYLANNNHSVELNDFSQQAVFFRSVMQNKTLFVYGEGGSHNLELNNQMRVYLLHEFSGINLKYFFIKNNS